MEFRVVNERCTKAIATSYVEKPRENHLLVAKKMTLMLATIPIES